MKNKCLLFLAVLSLSPEVSGERVEFPYECVPFTDRALSEQVWDVSSQDIRAVDVPGFVYSNPNGFITEYIGGDAEHYLLRGDSLIFRGYTRGRGTGALVDSTAATLRFSLTPGDSVMSVYSVSGSVEGVPVFRESGTVYGKVVREGRFVFAPGDTVPAILVHERRECTTNIGDSISAGNSDDFLRWYAPGSALPFALQYRRSDSSGARLFLPERFHGYEYASRKTDTPEDARQRIIDGAQVTVTESEATVVLGGLPGVEAEVYVIDVAGNIYGHTVRTLDGAANEFRISLTGIQCERCMLVITLGGTPQLTDKRML
ncbi:MAG: hypothetical protein J6J93_06680 [Muribaculaceae bacterium]|nr:hypothetical protein [Muribaculaceae bacterium]